MTSIPSDNYTIHFNTEGYQYINQNVKDCNYSKLFIILDSNTHQHCLSKFLAELDYDATAIEIIELQPGEEFKTIETCTSVWSVLTELGADRTSLIINLGGGVITDIGGFIASTFKRGIQFINIPTSLLAMVDASVGGKTGVDFNGLKNQIGVFSNPVMVIIDSSYLNTLPQRQLKSGLAEMFKHSLISDEAYWDTLKDLSKLNIEDLSALIHKSVVIKHNFVSKDKYEKGLRKALNFGHTLGHAIESYFLNDTHKTTLLHGEAIAIGMVLESYIASVVLNFDYKHVDTIKSVMLHTFSRVAFTSEDIKESISLLKHDKKNNQGKTLFVLLNAIGNPQIDCEVEEAIIYKAFDYYLS